MWPVEKQSRKQSHRSKRCPKAVYSLCLKELLTTIKSPHPQETQKNTKILSNLILYGSNEMNF